MYDFVKKCHDNTFAGQNVEPFLWIVNQMNLQKETKQKKSRKLRMRDLYNFKELDYTNDDKKYKK